jgi:hypothetical protein
MRPNVDDTGVMAYIHIQSELQYYHNVDTGSLVVHRTGKPFLKFNPQCMLSTTCFLDWVDSVADAIKCLNDKGVLYD